MSSCFDPQSQSSNIFYHRTGEWRRTLAVRPPWKYYLTPLDLLPVYTSSRLTQYIFLFLSFSFPLYAVSRLPFPPYISLVWHDLIWLTNDLINWWPSSALAVRKSWRGTNPTLAINDGEILVVWIGFFYFFVFFSRRRRRGESRNKKKLEPKIVCECGSAAVAAVCAALLTRFLMGFLEYLWYTHTHTLREIERRGRKDDILLRRAWETSQVSDRRRRCRRRRRRFSLCRTTSAMIRLRHWKRERRREIKNKKKGGRRWKKTKQKITVSPVEFDWLFNVTVSKNVRVVFFFFSSPLCVDR